MDLPRFEGWHLIGAFPDREPDDVGSWLLHHNGEAALLEVPPGLTSEHVRAALDRLGLPCLKYATASHDHEDHLDPDAWAALSRHFSAVEFLHPSGIRGDRLLHVGGEPLWLVKAPKHSRTDVVTIFRGVAMTGDIELGMLESVNDEVSPNAKRRGMRRAKGFTNRRSYHVHSVVSAHLNDVRIGIDWGSLFTV